MDALIAIAVIVGAFVIGSIAASIARRFATAEERPEAIQASSGAIATLALSVSLIIGLVIALGIVSSEALDQLSSDLVTFLPKVLSAAIVLIMGNIVGAVAETGVERGLGHVSPELRRRVPAVIKYAITGFAVIIAANQLGIDTTIITVVVASIFFSVGLAAALLAGLGGRRVAEQIAAGRALRQLIEVGDTVVIGDLEGSVSAIGSTTTQITHSAGVLFVPNGEVLDSRLEITPADETGNEERDQP